MNRSERSFARDIRECSFDLALSTIKYRHSPVSSGQTWIRNKLQLNNVERNATRFRVKVIESDRI